MHGGDDGGGRMGEEECHVPWELALEKMVCMSLLGIFGKLLM